MIVIVVQINVKPECTESFVNESQFMQNKSQKEPGCVGYQILRRIDNPDRFTFIETFESEEAISAHKETAHFKQWRANVYEMMASDRIAGQYNILE
jgi:autoinducer 2-degrading protein